MNHVQIGAILKKSMSPYTVQPQSQHLNLTVIVSFEIPHTGARIIINIHKYFMDCTAINCRLYAIPRSSADDDLVLTQELPVASL